MKFLIVDDDRAICESVKTALSIKFDQEHEFVTVNSGEAALTILLSTEIDILITDLNMGPGMNGIDLMRQARSIHPKTQMIIMTGFSSCSSAFDAGMVGAFAYIQKPMDLDHLYKVVNEVIELRKIQLEHKEFKAIAEIIQEAATLKTYNPKMLKIVETCKKIASNGSTVLITGESGTGKSMLARIIHDSSDRKEKPFVVVNCATLSESLLESEIFGHVKGAFTGAIKDKMGRFEAANGGTIFLDEIGEISPALQTKLLRFLQDHVFERVGDNKTIKVDVRIIAATNKNLEIAVSEGVFREDLYYRLNVIDIHVPTLKERPEDIGHLAETYLAKAFTINGNKPKPLSKETITVLQQYCWKGNVRELENSMNRAAILCTTDEVLISDLPDRIINYVEESATIIPITRTSSVSDNLEKVEKEMIQKVIRESRSIEDAAARLGINQSTLWRKRKRYGLE
jgi:NtrC-family two-component system response regulator AlgB